MSELKNRLKDLQSGMDIKRSILYIIFTNPQIYLGALIKRTLYIGALTFVLSWLYLHSRFADFQIHPATHQLIGFVIGLLLVFRTNTAYDRWWEGRKCIASISNAMCFYMMKLRSIANTHGDNNHYGEELVKFQEESRKKFVSFLNDLKAYLSQKDDHKIITLPFHKKQMTLMTGLLTEINKHVNSGALTASEGSTLDGYLETVMEYSNNCERIKNTPIPLGFLLHIKTSIFIYLLTLPLGLFHDLGLMSTFIIMTIYYVIGGIEIISNEIENPFAGDPNDLPLDELLHNIKESIK